MTIDTIVNPRTPSSAQIRAALNATFAAAEAIRVAGSIPSGHLYAMMMGHVSIDGYNGIIRQLKGAELVSESDDLLTWIGPTLSDGPLPPAPGVSGAAEALIP